MYKLLLCWRYLRTRYIALVPIISVMFGVGIMIVVNSVMSGFSEEMQTRLRGIYSDVVLESRSMDGMPNAEMHMREIERVCGEDIEAMSPTVSTAAMLNYQCNGQYMTFQVEMIGIDAKTQGKVSKISQYLQHPENRRQVSFELREDGYDAVDRQSEGDAPPREVMEMAGWKWRRQVAAQIAMQERLEGKKQQETQDEGPTNPFGAQDSPFQQPENLFDMAKDQHAGIVLGIGLVSYRDKDGKDRFLKLPGDDVQLTFPNTGKPPKGISDSFTVVDLYESKMSEHDAKVVFVPIERLQEVRGMIDPSTGVASVNAIQIKVKPGVDPAVVRDKLRAAFSPQVYTAYTWQDAQGAILSAVQLEITILNVLLFMIIAVAGFGILAIFYMIVVEKTRDIGILKSLGASRRGVMGIFLGYGLSLGIVGAGAGMVGGLLFVKHIDSIADLVASITGQKVFDPAVYYFYKIPTVVNPFTVGWIVLGAIGIAVVASIQPALRAAGLHPVEALRYE